MAKDYLLNLLRRVYVNEISADDAFNELEDLIDRINRLEDACDEAIAFCELLNPVAQTPNIPELVAKNLRKAKEAKP